MHSGDRSAVFAQDIAAIVADDATPALYPGMHHTRNLSMQLGPAPCGYRPEILDVRST